MAQVIDRQKVTVLLSGAKWLEDCLLRMELHRSDRNGQFYVTVDRIGNNENLYRSSETYVDKRDAEYAAALLIYAGLKAQYQDKTIAES